mmetsp:Transcript_507/g.1011  ORF Transcript_507/g.1011 Transcript_507/m.1011 type:complete len:212 (+) Transcript_507:3045-3680(+)
MYSMGSLGTALGISALGVKFDRISSRTLVLRPLSAVPMASRARICSVRNPRMTSSSSSLGFIGFTCPNPAGLATSPFFFLSPCNSLILGGLERVAPPPPPPPPMLPVSNDNCNLAKFSVVIGTVSELYPSSPALSTEFELCPSRRRLNRGVGVARRALTLPALGSISLPLRSTALTLDRAEEDDASLPASLASSPSTLLLQEDAAELPSSP